MHMPDLSLTSRRQFLKTAGLLSSSILVHPRFAFAGIPKSDRKVRLGEAVGYAAYVAKRNNASPREVYTRHLEEFMSIIESPLNIYTYPTLPNK